MLAEMQARLVYSFLKPAVRMAARFGIPIKTLVELIRLAYYEHLSREGKSSTDIARIFDQTPRHMRSLARRLESNFFAAERSVGLLREVETQVAEESPTEAALFAALATWPAADVREAIDQLLGEQRIARRGDHLVTAQHYIVLRTDQFHHRVDSLNHLLDGTYRAVLHRLLFDQRRTAMMKTISFSALPDQLEAYLRQLEGQLRVDIGAMDEAAEFQGRADSRFTLALTLAPANEPVEPEPSMSEIEE